MWCSCSSCGSRARLGTRCPHCGAACASPAGGSLAIALLGLTVGGCVTKDQPLYGVTVTDTLTDGTTEPATGETGDTGAR